MRKYHTQYGVSGWPEGIRKKKLETSIKQLPEQKEKLEENIYHEIKLIIFSFPLHEAYSSADKHLFSFFYTLLNCRFL